MKEAIPTDTQRLDWMFANIMERKVYVRDYDEDTGKFTFICRGNRADSPRAAIDAAMESDRRERQPEKEKGAKQCT